jgi:hypothetical protein
MEPQVVTNTQNNVLYLRYGDGEYKNLSTGISGQIDEKISTKIFAPNVEATYFWNEWEGFGDMVRRLNLKIDKI